VAADPAAEANKGQAITDEGPEQKRFRTERPGSSIRAFGSLVAFSELQQSESGHSIRSHLITGIGACLEPMAAGINAAAA
jgi:hypothetical protein